MEKADGLSRRPNQQEGIENNNENRMLIKSEWIQKKVRQGEETLIKKENLKEKIKKAQEEDKRVVKVVEELKQLRMKTLKDKEWSIEEKLVLKEDQIYIPEKEGLRTEIIQLYHDIPVGEHGGRQKTVELVGRNYWWPEIIKKVGRYVDGCNVCQKNKNYTEAPVGKLIPNTISEKL